MRTKHSPRPRAAHQAAAQAARDALPYRGPTDAARPSRLGALALPPASMAPFARARPLKSWRYLLFTHPELIGCAAHVRIGVLSDGFWALLDRDSGLFWSGRRGARVGARNAAIAGREVRFEVQFEPGPGIETVCAAGPHYGWTAKRAPLAATARWRGRELRGHVLVDDTAAYYERHTRWYWSAGVGHGCGGETVAWNLVSGVNDPPRNSERTVWIDGVAHEPDPSVFLADLSAVDELRFSAEATLMRRTELGLVRSDYRQPMGVFTGSVGGVALRDGLGVMERHDAWW